MQHDLPTPGQQVSEYNETTSTQEPHVETTSQNPDAAGAPAGWQSSGATEAVPRDAAGASADGRNPEARKNSTETKGQTVQMQSGQRGRNRETGGRARPRGPQGGGGADQGRKLKESVAALVKVSEKRPVVSDLFPKVSPGISYSEMIGYLNDSSARLAKLAGSASRSIPSFSEDMTPQVLNANIKRLGAKVDKVATEREPLTQTVDRIYGVANDLPLIAKRLPAAANFSRLSNRDLATWPDQIRRELAAQYPSALLKKHGYDESLWNHARSSAPRAAKDNLYATISSLGQSESPDLVEVAVAGENTSKDVGIADGVDVRKSVGILIGDNGQINVLHTCNVVKPVIQFADLTDAALRGASIPSVTTATPRAPEARVGLAAGYDSPIKVTGSHGVVEGDNSTLDLEVTHKLPTCNLNPEQLVADPSVRKLALAAAATPIDGDAASKTEHVATQKQLVKAVARRAKVLDGDKLFLDYTSICCSEYTSKNTQRSWTTRGHSRKRSRDRRRRHDRRE